MTVPNITMKLRPVIFLLCCLPIAEQANCGFNYNFGEEWGDGFGLPLMLSPSSSCIDQNLDKQERDNFGKVGAVGRISTNIHKHTTANNNKMGQSDYGNVIKPSQNQHDDKVKSKMWHGVTKTLTYLSPLNQRTHIKRRIEIDFGAYTHSDTRHSIFHQRGERRKVKNQQHHQTNNLSPNHGSTNHHQDGGNPCSTVRSYALPSSSSQLQPTYSFLNNTKKANIRVSVDPAAIGRLSAILFCAASSFGSAFMGTLRLLAPL